MSQKFEQLVSAWALLGGAILLVIVVVTSINVGAFTLDRMAGLLGQNVSGLPGYEDFVRLAISAAGLMFFPYCQLRYGHVNVDLFARHFPARVQRGLDILWRVVTAVVALGLAGYMVEGMRESRSDHAVSAVLGWSEWPFYGPGIVSLVLWAAVALYQIGSEGEASGHG
jgi:TRAP-type C4-dicarboxylate transport system permease small subunit